MAILVFAILVFAIFVFAILVFAILVFVLLVFARRWFSSVVGFHPVVVFVRCRVSSGADFRPSAPRFSGGGLVFVRRRVFR